MKLLYCPKCQDVRKLQYRRVFCECGKSWGNYLDDGLNAYVGGNGVPIGFDNHSFVTALKNRPQKGPGKRFEAFVIQHECDTILSDREDECDIRKPFTVKQFDEFIGWVKENLCPLMEDPDLVVMFDGDVVRKITFEKDDKKGIEISLDIGYDRYHAHLWACIWEDDHQTPNAVEDLKKRFRVLQRIEVPVLSYENKKG